MPADRVITSTSPSDRQIEDLRELSLGWEAKTSRDSFDMIERVYDRTRSRQGYRCIYPRCRTTRRSSEDMSRHVHTAHGKDSLPLVDFDPERWL